ncbi:MAG: NAD(P)/FAD-dependent oxidoreductase [Desulfovibrionaceae bacterium]
MKHYDAVVVGSGPGGGEVARGLNKAGLCVALVEKDGFGGVCPLRGCNPKKALLAGPEAAHLAAHLVGKGLAAAPEVDWPALAKHRDSFVEPISDMVENHYHEIGVDVYRGAASMTAPDAVRVEPSAAALEDGEEAAELAAGFIVLSPGMIPRPMDIPGSQLLSTSDDFLALDELPGRIAFLGGGFVALELAHIAAHAGARVALLSRSRPLKGFDPKLVEELVAASREPAPGPGIDLRVGPVATRLERTASGLVLQLSEGASVECDMVVNCTGRVPDLGGLGLAAGRVAAGPHGIEVNEYLQSTTNPGVYACGDAADTGLNLTPTATIEARAVVQNITGGNSAVPDYDGAPAVCFTLPPVASAGMAVEAARKFGVPHKVLEGSLASSFSWKRLGQTHGGYRIVVSEEEDRILGAHLFGHASEELINMFAAFIRLRVSLAGLRGTLWAYPTCGYYLKYMLG